MNVNNISDEVSWVRRDWGADLENNNPTYRILWIRHLANNYQYRFWLTETIPSGLVHYDRAEKVAASLLRTDRQGQYL